MAPQLLIRLTLAAASLALSTGLSSGSAATDTGPRTLSTLGDSAHAALLNAGTTLSAVGQDGSVGLGAQTLGRTDSAGAVEVAGVEVAGVTVGDGAAGGAARTVSTAGEPSLAALLSTATSVSGLGPSGAVATGITGFEG